ncbi:dienelactone hydrolase family protein [Dyadobacter sandarakinus]|uniref:Prolyl oligopeptidase family serine peptidase n=1 Tax=Dyadobacter sandarakinus TaxID=2747268 RepID=A0ABX7I672_9BACT|nr:prolyl oligopeptidase family serine peptidase [Dyadobacter sandarakinus]QRR01285.1 prolyl oligopeptidase family serine peptidase [Dyadobacter sandarakinus]
MTRHAMLLIAVLLLGCPLAGRAQNYDESKAGTYVLPELLQTESKEKIDNAKDWETKRRPELLALFEEHVYGRMPASYDKIGFRLTRVDPAAMQGRAILKEVEITVTEKSDSVKINLILFVPAGRKKPAPAMLLINNRSRRNTLASRDSVSGFWPAEQVIASGYAIAAFHYSDAAPDNKDTYQQGVLRLYPELARADDGMKAVGAWAWAASRAMDYLVTDKDIDARKVGVVGHSRGGKATLWAAAQDQRFAICFSNCSGNTGAALSRRNFGESVAVINRQFPHWFNNNYKQYNDNEQALPVDQHMLIALMAPRPVYATNATKDLWADPTGTFLAIKHAEPVFALYKQPSHLPAVPPAPDTPVTRPPLGYHNRTGVHDLTFFDWAQFVRFADAYYAK